MNIKELKFLVMRVVLFVTFFVTVLCLIALKNLKYW